MKRGALLIYEKLHLVDSSQHRDDRGGGMVVHLTPTAYAHKNIPMLYFYAVIMFRSFFDFDLY